MDTPEDPLARTAEEAGARLDMAIPPECVPGVEANLRLLAEHLATLRDAR